MINQNEIRHFKTALLRGYSVLKRLWQRNLVPDDLALHYFLHWFLVCDGNIVQAAKELNVHRNTIENYFRKFGFSKKAVLLRNVFFVLEGGLTKTRFEDHFYNLYNRFNDKTKLSRFENKLLINLWQTRFPLKTLQAHYLLWAIRSGKSKDWVCEKLGCTERNCLLLLRSVLNTKTRNGFWLAPLKPQSGEIYKRGPAVKAGKAKERVKTQDSVVDPYPLLERPPKSGSLETAASASS